MAAFQIGDDVVFYNDATNKIAHGVVIDFFFFENKYCVATPKKEIIRLAPHELIYVGHETPSPVFSNGDVVRVSGYDKVFKVVTSRGSGTSPESDGFDYTLYELRPDGELGALRITATEASMQLALKLGEPEEVITIARLGNITKVVRKFYGKDITSASVYRSHNDKHNMHVAAIYALDKLFKGDGVDVTLGKPQPETKPNEWLNGMVVVIENNGTNTKEFPVGKVLQFVEGRAVNPATNYLTKEYRSVTELNTACYGLKFAELKL